VDLWNGGKPPDVSTHHVTAQAPTSARPTNVPSAPTSARILCANVGSSTSEAFVMPMRSIFGSCVATTCGHEMNGVDGSRAGRDHRLKPKSRIGKTAPLECGRQMGSEADLRAASLNRPRNPTTDPVIRWNGRRGSRATPVELVEKHEAAATKVP
jgi:hypothetical protein